MFTCHPARFQQLAGDARVSGHVVGEHVRVSAVAVEVVGHQGADIAGARADADELTVNELQTASRRARQTARSGEEKGQDTREGRCYDIGSR